MKLTKPRKPFTQDDFEKGLMLAGLLSPVSIQEIKERESVNELEKQEAASAKQIYFKRVVLAAEIVFKLHQEPTLGRTKFQKLVFLCEHVVGMSFQDRYRKLTAGPFDNKFMHSVVKEFERNNWFTVEERFSNGIKRAKYIALENAGMHKDYYDRYFSNQDEGIQNVIELFRNATTQETELAATVLACITELKIAGERITRKSLLSLFYGWSTSKGKFKEEDVITCAVWLKKKGFTDEEIDQNEIE